MSYSMVHWQTKMLDDYRTLEELLDVERELCDRLDEQINDLSELHHNEIVNIRQVPFLVQLCTVLSLPTVPLIRVPRGFLAISLACS